MARPLKKGTHIYVEHRQIGASYAMPSMEIATDHYSLGYTVSGDRKCIMSRFSYSFHAGDVSMMAPYLYHQTFPESDTPYESILIKFAPEFIEPFIAEFGQPLFDELYEKHVCHFAPDSKAKIERLFFDMNDEFKKSSPHREFILQGMLFHLLTVIWDEALDEALSLHPVPLTAPILDAVAYLERSYRENPSVADAARVANFSTGYFSRLFAAQLGKSYTDYLDSIKLRHVTTLLIQTDKSIMEIAQETGYCHGNYLCEKFRKKMGMTPSEYRRQHLPLS